MHGFKIILHQNKLLFPFFYCIYYTHIAYIYSIYTYLYIYTLVYVYIPWYIHKHKWISVLIVCLRTLDGFSDGFLECFFFFSGL